MEPSASRRTIRPATSKTTSDARPVEGRLKRIVVFGLNGFGEQGESEKRVASPVLPATEVAPPFTKMVIESGAPHWPAASRPRTHAGTYPADSVAASTVSRTVTTGEVKEPLIGVPVPG